MNDTTIGTKLTNTHRIIYVNSKTFDDNTANRMVKLDNSEPIIYVKNPTITPVYGQSDPSTIIGSTTVYNSNASILDIIDSTTMIYVAGAVLVLYLILS